MDTTRWPRAWGYAQSIPFLPRMYFYGWHHISQRLGRVCRAVASGIVWNALFFSFCFIKKTERIVIGLWKTLLSPQFVYEVRQSQALSPPAFWSAGWRRRQIREVLEDPGYEIGIAHYIAIFKSGTFSFYRVYLLLTGRRSRRAWSSIISVIRKFTIWLQVSMITRRVGLPVVTKG